MIWVYIVVAIVLVLVIVLKFSKKGKNPSSDSSLTIDEKEQLREDYLSHGNHDEQDDNKNI